jgi:hypothetical protein
MNDSPKWLVVLSIFLAILTLLVGWVGFLNQHYIHRLAHKHRRKKLQKSRSKPEPASASIAFTKPKREDFILMW